MYQLEAMLRNLAGASMMSGDLAAANSSFMEALQLARRVDNRLTQLYGLSAAGWYAGSSGQARTATSPILRTAMLQLDQSARSGPNPFTNRKVRQRTVVTAVHPPRR